MSTLSNDLLGTAIELRIPVPVAQGQKKRGTWRRRRTTNIKDIQLTENQSTFLYETTRGLLNLEEESLRFTALFYCQAIEKEAVNIDPELYQAATGSNQLEEKINTSWKILTLLIQCMSRDGFYNVNRFISRAIEQQLMLDDCEMEGNAQNAARRLTLSAFGQLTRFFYVDLPNEGSFIHLNTGQLQAQVPEISESSKFARPMVEILDMFEDLLPTNSPTPNPLINPANPQISSTALHASCLNAALLSDLLKVNFRWTRCLASHFEYDAVSNTLNLFALPSFLYLQRSENSIFSMALSSYYNGRNPPEHYTSGRFSQEILLTYKLLFGQNHRAHTVWVQHERHQAALLSGTVDPTLDTLCKVKDSNPALALSHDLTHNFPILGERLRHLQNHVLNQDANGIVALWRDRRDTLRWWTFWAVIVVGSLGILIAIIQTILSGLQLAYAIRAVQQTSNS